ncbi:hypothetical protein [Aurantiacibacter gangjinensis]|nr:hypothetical protein [Aurantiacibacter gangjinensis]APE26885.1 hypothetical protein BMF35_a0056 [Aurantiacibacter gangjinensis]
MGSIQRAGRFLIEPVLTDIRNRPEDARGAAYDRRLAIALSLLSHIAADSYFKPVYREIATEYYDNEYRHSPSDMRIMQDTALWHLRREMPLAQNDPKYDPLVFEHALRFTSQQSAEQARHLEHMFGGLIVQQLLQLHELYPEGADAGRMLRGYIIALDPIYIDTARYADLSAQPYLNHAQRYLIEPRFYDPADPFIALSVDVQNGADPDPDRLQEAMSTDPATLSQWGTSLRFAVEFFESAQRYVDGEIALGEFTSSLELED